MRVRIDNWRWAGVPFLLRSGKRLAKRVSEIAVQFKQPPLHLFREIDDDGEVGFRQTHRPTSSSCASSRIPGFRHWHQ